MQQDTAPDAPVQGANVNISPDWRQQMLARWRKQTKSADPVQAAVGRAMLDAWRHTRRADEHREYDLPPARWAEHLAELTDPPTRSQDDRHYQCGHSQMHHSSSNTCMWVNLDWGRWGCRSCLQGGDVVGWVALHEHVTRNAAFARLLVRYG